jgi:hypothetical protein
MKPTEELHANEGRVLSATFTLPDLGKSCLSLGRKLSDSIIPSLCKRFQGFQRSPSFDELNGRANKCLAVFTADLRRSFARVSFAPNSGLRHLPS